MAQISVTINGKTFRMACDDGEEERLLGLAKRFDDCIGDLKTSFGEIGDQRLTVMAGIMVTDQLQEMERRIKLLETELSTATDARIMALDKLNRSQSDIITKIDEAAGRIETLADDLNSSLKTD